ncbi:MAG TPA: CNNM domain-containing protein, partial [Armatimonadota bacterium]|nr:CNNM domain-containing protein [Armatimonadota bacterium]
MDSLFPYFIMGILILLNGLFVAAEFAIVGAPRAAIERKAAQGNRAARMVNDILHDAKRQDRYIATAQLGITFASLGLGMYGEHYLAGQIVHLLESLGAAKWIAAHAIASVAAVGILTYFHIVVGEMVPKSLALEHAEKTVLWITPPMMWIKGLMYPLVVGVNDLGNGILRIFGIKRQATGAEYYHTSEELQYIIEESLEGGMLHAESGQVLRDLFEFGELDAGEVMVPRVKIQGIPLHATHQ